MESCSPLRIVALLAGGVAWTCASILTAEPVPSEIAQPRSVRFSSYDYESYYYDDGCERSPSDMAPAPVPALPSDAAPMLVAAPSGPSCGCGSPRPVCSLSECLCGCDPWMRSGGWTQLGYHSDYTPLSSSGPGNQGLSFNDRPDRLNLHQQWLWLEKQADGSRGVDFGFRFDVLYGIDAQKTQAYGNPGANVPNFGAWDASLDHGAYGWAMPQLYGQVAVGELSIIAGHFFSPVGYEVVAAPGNFFYSHSLTMYNSEPATHTGLLATYGGIDGVKLYGGWTLGWDTGFDQADSGNTYLGGFSGELTDGVTVTYLSTIGNIGLRSGGGSGYSHSVVLEAAITDDLNYVLQSDYLDYVDYFDRKGGPTGPAAGDDQLGVNQYLFYTLNDITAVGARMEWWKSDGVSYYEVTYGMNYRLSSNQIVRPEIRYDWSPGGAYGDGSNHQTTFGIDWIRTY